MKKLGENEQITEAVESITSGDIVLGNIKALDELGRPSVVYSYSGNFFEQIAECVIPIDASMTGKQVALNFISGDVRRPIVMGLVYSPLFELIDQFSADKSDQNLASEVDAEDAPLLIDGKKVVLEGKEQVELRCGDASITLTKSGKILIRGKYLLNRASGVNRILGGSVQVN